VINSTREALEAIGNRECQKIVILAIIAVSEEAANKLSTPHRQPCFRHSAAISMNQIGTGAPTTWWHGTSQAGML